MKTLVENRLMCYGSDDNKAFTTNVYFPPVFDMRSVKTEGVYTMASEADVKTEMRKYTVAEIDAMRRSIDTLTTPLNSSFNAAEIAAKVESRLRTYMQNGTDPDELAKAASDRLDRHLEAQRRDQEMRAEMRAKAPPPRVLKTKEDVIDEWFQTCVAQYDGASVEASELFDGFMGRTLTRFAKQHAPDGVNIGQRDMERYLDSRGIKSRRAMFAKRYDGIRHIVYGNVRSGTYGT